MEEENQIEPSLEQEQGQEEIPNNQDEIRREEKQIEPSLEQEQEQGQEEILNNQDEIQEEDKVIPMIEPNKFQGDVMVEQRHEDGAEVKVGKGAFMEEGKVGDSLKKSKQGSKQNLIKSKVTIPQPFCLETEKRMSRERRSSMDFKDLKPSLSRSSSLNYRGLSQSSSGAERNSDLRRSKTTATTKSTSLPPRAKATEPVDKGVENGPKAKNKAQGKETEKKRPQPDAKEGGGEVEGKKIQKSATFKALPLPSFYQQKAPIPRPETKKISASQIKSPLHGQETKSVPNKCSGDSKGKMVTKKTISSSAKESITKLLKTTGKSPNHHMVKAVVSSVG